MRLEGGEYPGFDHILRVFSQKAKKDLHPQILKFPNSIPEFSVVFPPRSVLVSCKVDMSIQMVDFHNHMKAVSAPVRL